MSACPRAWLRVWLLALALLLGQAAGGARAEGFLSAIPDLPLMPGLVELAERGVVFDKAGGRIVEAYAQGEVAGAAVRRFYGDTLPQLGWQASPAGSFLREGEKLEVAVLSEGGGTLVRFTLKPR